jgi:hypothetical protein
MPVSLLLPLNGVRGGPLDQAELAFNECEGDVELDGPKTGEVADTEMLNLLIIRNWSQQWSLPWAE